MRNVIIFGGPGSGKGTQSKHIADKYGLYHISTGDVLRDHISRDTEIGKIADSYISKGHLIPDDLMIDILTDLLESKPEETAGGVIFDGFPRTLVQAEKLDEMMKRHGHEISTVLGLEVPDDVLTDRLVKRGADSGRADDNLETIKHRLNVYHSQTKPLIDYYKQDGRYHCIDGADDIAGVFSQISDHLDNLK